MNEVLFGFDYIAYYFYLLYYKFMGYPIILRICVAIVTLCVLFYLFLAIYLLYGIVRRRKEKRAYNKIYKRYYDPIHSVSFEPVRLKENEVAERLKYDPRKILKHKELRHLVQVLTKVKSEMGDQVDEFNFQSIQSVFKVSRFFEREIQFGKRTNKVQALKSIQSINGYASEAVLVRFLYHRKLELRNAARFSYMWLSQNSPFRFFDEDITMKLRKWDMADLHTILVHRQKSGFVIPNFIKWVGGSVEEDVKIFFVHEIHLFNQMESCASLVELLNTKTLSLRSEIIKTLGTMKYTESEPKLIEIYDIQPEFIKWDIIAAVSEMKTGNGVEFLRSAYEEADDMMTRLCAIRGLYEYNEAGLHTFAILEAQAKGFATKLFAHVRNPLINRA